MAGFLSTTKTFTCKDKYSSYWQQASVKVTINSAGKISWTVTMNNDREGSKGRGVYLHIKINGQTVKSKGYTVYDDPSSSKWLTYPTGNGSTDSGTLTMQNTSGEYVTVYIYICCMQNSTSAGATLEEKFYRTKWTDVTKGSVSITDNGNNKFTLKATDGKAGTNNAVVDNFYKWGYDTNYSNTFKSGDTITLPESLGAGNATATVYAKVITDGTHGDNAEASTSLAVKHYHGPGNPGKPTITYTKSRLTIKENWKINWSTASAANGSSPVKGYRIRVWKVPKGGGTETTIKIYDSSGNLLSGDSADGPWRYRYDRPVGTNYPIPMTFVTAKHDIQPGDKIRIGLYAYTTDAQGTKIFSADEIYSNYYLVQNAGVVRITLVSCKPFDPVHTAAVEPDRLLRIQSGLGNHEAD